MALSDHDRLDRKLSSLHFVDAACGSVNLQTGQAEYCGYDCPTLRARMAAGDDPGVPVGPVVQTRVEPFDPTRVGPQ